MALNSKNLRQTILGKLEENEPEKGNVTLFLNKLNFTRLKDQCEERNEVIRKGKKEGKLIKPSEIIDQLIKLYLDSES